MNPRESYLAVTTYTGDDPFLIGLQDAVKTGLAGNALKYLFDYFYVGGWNSVREWNIEEAVVILVRANYPTYYGEPQLYDVLDSLDSNGVAERGMRRLLDDLQNGITGSMWFCSLALFSGFYDGKISKEAWQERWLKKNAVPPQLVSPT